MSERKSPVSAVKTSVFRMSADFIYFCFVTPGFFIASMGIYLKLARKISDWTGYPLYQKIEDPIEFLSWFIDRFFYFVIEIPIESSLRFLLFILSFAGLEWSFRFPEWYSSAAFFSTVLYGAQVAAMQAFRPQ